MKQLKKEFEPLILFIAAILVFGTLSVFGMVYNLGKSIYECFQLKFWRGPVHFIKYWLKVLYQFWNVIKYFLMKSAISIDLFGNVAAGEMIEDVATTEENTLYGNGEVTVSAATGYEEVKGKLVPTGIMLTNLLSNVLGKNHCIEAYEKELERIINLKK